MLEVRNVSKIYHTKEIYVEALKDVSIKFVNHGFYFILGKSGCGKSTFLNLIAGLDNVTSGEILLDGEDITKFNSNELNQYRNYNIGFVFQEFNLIPNLNVKENIALSLKMQGLKATEEKILEILKQVEMSEFLYRKINELSGGQKQRIAIARALIKNPKIIVADEPTGALDSETSKQIFSLLKLLSETHLVIVVSHHEEYAKEFADEIIYLKDGSIDRQECFHPIESNFYLTKDVPKKSYLPFLTSLQIGFSNLKINLIRLSILIFLSVISFVCLGVSITAFQYNKDVFVSNAIAESGFIDPLTIISIHKKSESSWQQTTISPTFINDLNEKIEGTYLGVYKGVGRSDSNFKESIKIDYSGTYDALSLFSMSGIAVINQNIISDLGFNIFGQVPTQSNEILITRYFFETFLKYGYSYKNNKGDGNISQEQDIIGKIIEIPKYRNSNIMEEYIICGIMDTKIDTSKNNDLLLFNSDKTELKEAQRLFLSYQTNSIHSVGFVSKSGMDLLYKFSDEDGQGYDSIVGLMPKDKKKLVKIMQYLDDLSDEKILYQLTNTTDTWIKDVDTLMTTYKMIGGIAGLVLIVFSSLLLYNYINLSISHKIKEMGILRALGARGKDIFKIFGCEGFLIAFINFILSVIGTFILVFIINNGIIKEYFLNTSIYQLNFLTILSLFLISFLSCFLSIFIPIVKVSKKSPIETIRVE